MSSQLPARPPSVDLGPALRGLTSDPGWLKKYSIAGLCMLIPVAGPVALLGWTRRIYDASKAGDDESLPDVALGQDLRYGVAPFAAIMNLAVPAMVLAFFVWGVAFGMIFWAGQGSGGELSDTAAQLLAVVLMLANFLFMAGIFVLNVLMPEFQRRGFNGETTPLLSVGTSVRAIMGSPGGFFTVIIGLFVANAISSVGVFVCYVGMIVSVPMAMAVYARLLAQWDDVVAATGS